MIGAPVRPVAISDRRRLPEELGSGVTDFLEADPSVHLHYTVTYASWRNHVELSFATVKRDVAEWGTRVCSRRAQEYGRGAYWYRQPGL